MCWTSVAGRSTAGRGRAGNPVLAVVADRQRGRRADTRRDQPLRLGPGRVPGRRVVAAAALQVPADHLVTNADLSFTTRDLARDLPERLDAKEALDDAVEVLAEVHGWDAEEARRRLRTAAARAGAPVETIADLVLACTSTSRR